MCFAITLLESNKIIAQTKLMFNKKNNSLPNFIHVCLVMGLQVVWGSVVHHPGLRGRSRRRVKQKGSSSWCLGTVPTQHYAICHLTHVPVPPSSFNRERAAISPPRARMACSVRSRGGVCTHAKDRGGIVKGGKGKRTNLVCAWGVVS